MSVAWGYLKNGRDFDVAQPLNSFSYERISERGAGDRGNRIESETAARCGVSAWGLVLENAENAVILVH